MARPQPGYESLAYILKPNAGGRVGDEEEFQITESVWEYVSGDNAEVSRFVKRVDDKVVAAAVVWTDDEGNGHVISIYTRRGHRRRGHATELLEWARKMFPVLTVSDDRSAAGRALCDALGY